MDIVDRQLAIEDGLVRYFTGEACKRGHVAERYTTTGGCVECNFEDAAISQARRRERIKAGREAAKRVAPDAE